MKLLKNIMAIAALFIVVSLYTVAPRKQRRQEQRQQVQRKRGVSPQRPAPSTPAAAAAPVEWQPAVVTKQKLSMESYINNKVNALQGNLINDIFPKKDTIERIVLDFKLEYPGPDKDTDTVLIYEAIINNPAIKKMITLENGVQVYKLVRGTIDEVWERQNEAIWAR